ncbi:MAG: NUDIX domain-containing protein [Clostridiales bacterium]|nr:NUDIX domain-containing protein [Clostridiales bacterium]
MEIMDIYDGNRVKTDRTHVRGDALSEGEYVIVVAICIFNSKGEMLVQQRQPFKEGWPNMWDITAAGSATTGETSQQAAARELQEEIGYKRDLTNERPFLTVNGDYVFVDIYLLEDDVNINDLVLQYEEVKSVQWASKEDIFQMIGDNTFIPYYKGLVEMLFEMRHQRGTHNIKLK